MKYINDLAYANLLAQTKHLAKDKKQKNKYRQTVLLENNQGAENVSKKLYETLNALWEGDDRRTGKDRRESQQERGRYVESRLNKNRRYKAELSVKV